MGRAEMAANDEAIVRYQKGLCVHGHHVYKEIWEDSTVKTLEHVAETELLWLLKRMGKLSAF